VNTFYFVTDLHGHIDRYQKFLNLVETEKPAAVFLGGDLLPHHHRRSFQKNVPDFFEVFLFPEFSELQKKMSAAYPRIFIILGNDDERCQEIKVLEGAKKGFWEYINFRKSFINHYPIYGYAFVPPTPFLLKDWEKYDISRFVDPGCVPPEEGYRSVPIDEKEIQNETIADDLKKITGDENLDNAIFLFHSPPYQTKLDRAALDGQMIDHVPMDVHVGSMAIKRFIETRQPLITLHGHVHESTRITGVWKEQIGRTWSFNAAHDGRELAVIKFDPEKPAEAIRELH